MHFYEASIITTKDGFHCQVYGNNHPADKILVKPKYIPTDKIECKDLQCRFISGRKMNRLNMWSNQEGLKEYIKKFKEEYPEYIFKSEIHDKDRLFFAVPINKIERIYSPKRGVSELLKIERENLDEHLKLVYDFLNFLLKSNLLEKDLGITYSSLVGHYKEGISDINIVVYGKENFWKLMKYLQNTKHEKLRWKSSEEWEKFYKKRNRKNFFEKREFVEIMKRKKSEGFFGNSLFVIFCAENKDEAWFKWGSERYESLGVVKIKGTVKDDYNSIVRPGYYELENTKIIEGYKEVPIRKIVFYSRDYAMIARKGEQIEACGLLEKVKAKKEEYYRIVIGYFDSYLNERREKEFVKPIGFLKETPKILKNDKNNNLLKKDNLKKKTSCIFCRDSKVMLGNQTSSSYEIIYVIGDSKENSWFATLSPVTGGNPEKDFTIQLMPKIHLTHFSQIYNYSKLAKNYGIAFSEISAIMAKILSKDVGHFNSEEKIKDNSISLGVYGKCTDWEEKKEHLHIKLFPFRGDIGQPYTLDSSFGKKKVFNDGNAEYIKMKPVTKKKIPQQRFDYLKRQFLKFKNEIN